MASQPHLVLVDCGPGSLDRAQRELWERSEFRERVAALGGPVRLWGDRHQRGPWPSVCDAAGLDRALEESRAASVVVVESGQLFLDVSLAREGLASFDPAFHDSFTQWEHCRLPVGMGVRALSARTWRGLGAPSPMDAFAALRREPGGRRFAYDATPHVSYRNSLLDARDGEALRALLAGDAPTSWDLAGFLSLVGDADRARLRYRPEGRAPRVDERFMPAPYGFESTQCAHFPTYVMFDITNVCNARCIHCPQGLRDEDGQRAAFLRQREHQPLEVFQRVIDECAEHEVSFVRITADGEPLVHPQLFEMLEYARDRGVGPVGLTTNGSLLNEERAERLLASGVGVVDFSLDALTPETFAEVRVGLDYEKTHQNVSRFIELVAARRAPVKVMVSFVKQSANAHEVEAFRRHWAARVDEVVIREMISNVGLNEPSEVQEPGADSRWPCAHFFRRVVVNHQGVLKACPIDWEQRTTHEHVERASLFEQWHGDFYWRHRMQHLNDRIEPSSACHDCRDWIGTPWELGYEKIIERVVEPVGTH